MPRKSCNVLAPASLNVKRLMCDTEKMNAKFDYQFKFLLIGNSNVGKSCMLLKFSDEAFSTSYVSTIGVDFKIRTVDLKGKRIKLQIWDTAGQERFSTITESYYRGSHGIMLVYDITNGESFDKVEKWLRKIEEHATGNVEKMLIGNKCDLNDRRVVLRELGEALALKHSMMYIETSAKLNINIQEAFMQLTEAVLDRKLREELVPEVKPDNECPSLSVDLQSVKKDKSLKSKIIKNCL